MADTSLSGIKFIQESLCQLLGSLGRLVGRVYHLVLSQILPELEPRKTEVGGKLLNAASLGNLDLITLDRLSFACIVGRILVIQQLLLIVGAQIADDGVEVVQLALVLGLVKLLLIVGYVRILAVSKMLYPLKEV